MVVTFLLSQFSVPFSFGKIRTYFPFFTCVSTKQPLSFFPPTSVGPSIPCPSTSARKSWIFLASSRNRDRVRPLLPFAFTTLLTTSRKKSPDVHAWAANPSAWLLPPIDFRNASTDLFCLASSNGTKNSDAYCPSTAAPPSLRNLAS